MDSLETAAGTLLISSLFRSLHVSLQTVASFGAAVSAVALQSHPQRRVVDVNL